MSDMSWLVEFIREQGKKYNPLPMMLGEVSALPPSLKIKAAGIELEPDDLLAAADLLVVDALRIGDTVAVMPMQGGQTFIVLCKVVKPNG
ncbi:MULTISPECIES: DUF2577 family protein [unclassified Paenibacillus]|uniref:DUF2577 family protein n=1 Tax=unclassified Paenibacillus TaxID=185978 RepID=UPI001C0FE389|nr:MULTISPECIES: DUF2577 family protein [unclassified Paenibacillus]MBU5444324.1 DUF2577 domain-containing protein [Paenibacillus sp. MSJ-34]CAH0121054.1 hypothetical protein PAE9249_03580 [Paenibacillus sp. CECT 9249]